MSKCFDNTNLYYNLRYDFRIGPYSAKVSAMDFNCLRGRTSDVVIERDVRFAGGMLIMS